MQRRSTAWVVGGSRGLGYATARALLGRGFDVTISARSADALDHATETLAEEWRRARPDTTVRDGDEPAVRALPLDVSDEERLTSALAELVSDETLPDVVVVSGGGPPPSKASTLTPDVLDEAYRTVLRPAATILGAVSEPMARRGSGVVVFVTSSGVREPIPNLAPSNIMRAGVTAMAKNAADELAGRGVRVLCVAPGRIGTERVAELDEAAAAREQRDVADVRGRSQASIPAGRYGTPEEFGAVVAFLCTSEASYLTGTTISVDGGKSRGLLS